MTPMIDRYAVIGNPVAHSKSPTIHTLFARETAQHLEYTAILSPLDAFAETVAALRAAGGCGCNITLPFKRQAWEMADERSRYAQRAGALNTLLFRADGSLYGHNTDGIGLLRDLQVNHDVTLRGRRVLLLGAGGAVRGVLEPLLEAGPAEVFVANRTVATARALAEDFSTLGTIAGGGFADIEGVFDLVINGTAASLQGDLPPLPTGCLRAEGVAYDMMYAAEPTVFMRWAQTQSEQGKQGERGTALQVLDGLGMLVEQAAESFALWRGVRPETAAVLRALRTGVA